MNQQDYTSEPHFGQTPVRIYCITFGATGRGLKRVEPYQPHGAFHAHGGLKIPWGHSEGAVPPTNGLLNHCSICRLSITLGHGSLAKHLKLKIR